MFETQTIYLNMIEIDISSDEFRPAPGVITSLSQLTKEQFHDLMTSKHPSAKKYRDYAKKEFDYRMKSYHSLNDLFNHNSNT
jgi:16S rRNA A1518/A1519 N6-dimethyltransferase RsmA/KsgA/DIM1 with predicted DNA glycosylase/AP lyase activity